MKQPPRQVRLDPDVEEQVDKIAEVTGLPKTEVIRQMVRAGTQAIKANGYRLPLPLLLRIAEGEPPRRGEFEAPMQNLPPPEPLKLPAKKGTR